MEQMSDPTPPGPRAPRAPLWHGLLLTGLIGASIATLVAVAVIAWLVPKLPSVEALSEQQLKVPMRIYSTEGQLLAEFGEEKRILLKPQDVPALMIEAILAAEDSDFYEHHGVDFAGIARAMWHNLRSGTPGQGASTITMQVARNFFLSPEKTYTRKLKEILLAFKIERELSKDQILELYLNKIFLGNRAYGFGAAAQVYYGKALDSLSLPEIAMLAGLPKAPSRNNPLSNPESALERRNYVLHRMHTLEFIDTETYETAKASPLTASRHAQRYEIEAPYVAEMVRQYMVERYSEQSYEGGFHVHTTIQAASQQAANVALRRGLREYERRHGYRGPAGHVRLEQGEIDQSVLDDALKDYRIVGDLLPGIVLHTDEQRARVYTQDGYLAEIGWAGLEWARRYIDPDKLGAAPKKAADVVSRGDIVYLEYVEPDVKERNAKIEDSSTAGKGYWRLTQVPSVAGALVALRPSDGAIIALTGGFDFNQSKFNRATQAERQPGSNIKPFIYSAALERGFTAATPVSGAPIVINDPGLEELWRPDNYSERFFGPTPLRKALALSINLVSVRLLRAIEPQYAVEYLQRFGFNENKLPHNLSLALGTASATPLQMSIAFAVFANGGYRVEPYFITRIEDAQGNIIEQANPLVICRTCADQQATPAATMAVNPPASGETASAAPYSVRLAPQVISAQNAFIMRSMMQDVITHGTGRRALELGRADLAGKTGTTNEFRDAWFSGFTENLVTTAWIGFDQPAPLGRGESGARAALPIWVDFMRVALKGIPEKIPPVPEGVVAESVDRDSGEAVEPSNGNAIVEYFFAGTEPTAVASGPQAPQTEPGESAPVAQKPPPVEIPKGLF